MNTTLDCIPCIVRQAAEAILDRPAWVPPQVGDEARPDPRTLGKPLNPNGSFDAGRPHPDGWDPMDGAATRLIDCDGRGQVQQEDARRLAEGEEQVFVVKCSLDREGFTRLKAEASGGSVSAEATAVTRVESIADLALSVKDPAGPVPVGQMAMYTVHIRNRGTKAASGVEAVIYFSQGIEPVSAEGGRHTIRPGQVVFDAIDVVPAGKEVVLKIAARAQTPGNHMFRAEVHCRPLGTKLVGEESTHFYRGDLEPSSPRTMIADTPPQTTEAAETTETAEAPAA